MNGEITHYLRDKGFLIFVSGRWRELHARGQKLERWAEIAAARSARVEVMNSPDQEFEL